MSSLIKEHDKNIKVFNEKGKFEGRQGWISVGFLKFLGQNLSFWDLFCEKQ